MATIGTIAVAFETSGVDAVQKSIDAISSSLVKVSKEVDSLSSSLDRLSGAAIKLSVDTSALDKAKKSIAGIEDDSEIKIEADAEEVEEAAEEVEKLGKKTKVAKEDVKKLGETMTVLSDLSDSLTDSFKKTAAAGQSLASGGGTRSKLNATGEAINAVSAAVSAMGTAFGVSGNNVGKLFSERLDVSTEAMQDAMEGSSLLKGAINDMADGVLSSLAPFATAVGFMNNMEDGAESASDIVNALGSGFVKTAASAGILGAASKAVGLATSGMSEGFQSVAQAALSLDLSQAIGPSREILEGLGVSTEDYERQIISLTQVLKNLSIARRIEAASIQLSRKYYEEMLPIVASMATSMYGLNTATLVYKTTIGQLVPQVAGFLASVVPMGQALKLGANATKASSSEFAVMIAKFVAMRAAIGAAKGAYEAYVVGASIATGATAGAGAALSAFGAMIPGIAVASVAFAVASGRVAEELKHIGQNAALLGDLSYRFGQSVQEIEKLKIAAEGANVPLNAVVRAQQSFAQNVSKVKIGNLGSVQTREAKAAFDQLGISVESLRSKSPEKLFEEVAVEISKMGDATERTQVAMDIFGRMGPTLLPLLKNLEQVNADIGRLGGTISDIDISRFQAIDQSFSRLRTASGALKDDLMIPFTRMQEAFNNAQAEIIGGIAPIVGAVGELVADMTTPFAVVIEVIARVVNTMLRIVAAMAKIVEAIAGFSGITAVIEVAADEFFRFWSMIESGVAVFEEFASTVEEAFRGSVESVHAMGEAVRELIDSLTSLVGFSFEESFGSGADALIGIVTALTLVTVAVKTYSAVMQIEAVKTQVALLAIRVAWVGAFALGAVAAVAVAVGALAVFVAAVVTTAATFVAEAIKMHIAWLIALGPIGLIIAAVELLAAAVAALIAWGPSLLNWVASWGVATIEVDGATASVEELTAAVASVEAKAAVAKTGLADIGVGRMDEIAKTITDARRGFDDLNINAAKFGTVGEEAAIRASEKFSELQRKLGSGKITAEEFASGAEDIKNGLASALEAIEKSSPEEELKKSIKAFAELNSAAKAVEATVRKLGDDVQIGDKLFPRSAEIKARASEYAEEYKDALDEIKQKLASGGFQQELDAKKKKNQQAFDNKEISEEEFKRTKRSLDSTTAQEQAALAAEEAQKEFDKKQLKIKIDMSFADDLRKQLENAFKSPGQLLEENLKKLRENIELTAEEKTQGEKLLRQQQKEKLFGKTAEEKLVERSRDISEAKRQGIIDPARAAEEQVKARREFLGEFGVETSQKTLDQERLKKIQEAALTTEERASAQKALQESIVGKSSFTQRQEQEDRIRSGIAIGAVDANAGAEALRKLTEEFESSLGIVKTPAEQASSKIADIADKFGLAGQNLEEMRKSLAGNKEGLDQLNRAAKEVRDGLLAAFGITKDPTEQLEEDRKKIAEAVAKGPENGGLTAAEGARAEALAIRKRDEALGANPGVGQFVDEFAQRRQAIENAFGKDGAKDPEKFASAMKNLNESMLPGGAGKPPVEKFKEDMEKLNAVKGQLTDEEFAERKLAVQAELSDNLQGLEGADRRQVGASDVRSKEGVNTFFRILQGQDNPSLKAQLQTMRNTKAIADALADPEAREVVVQMTR